MKLEEVKTVGDLKKYLSEYSSPVVVDILQRAIQFFSADCLRPDGKKDWRAIKERKKMGLSFQLKDETKMTKEVVVALNRWVATAGYGREMGTSFLDAATDQATGGQGNPREQVYEILNFFVGNKIKKESKL